MSIVSYDCDSLCKPALYKVTPELPQQLLKIPWRVLNTGHGFVFIVAWGLREGYLKLFLSPCVVVHCSQQRENEVQARKHGCQPSQPGWATGFEVCNGSNGVCFVISRQKQLKNNNSSAVWVTYFIPINHWYVFSHTWYWYVPNNMSSDKRKRHRAWKLNIRRDILIKRN